VDLSLAQALVQVQVQVIVKKLVQIAMVDSIAKIWAA
jgi:hypothetical protein